MRNHHYGRAFAVYLQKSVHYFRRSGLVKRACGLIRENDLRLHYHAAAYTGSLKLTAGDFFDIPAGKFTYIQLIHKQSCSFIVLFSVFLI